MTDTDTIKKFYQIQMDKMFDLNEVVTEERFADVSLQVEQIINTLLCEINERDVMIDNLKQERV